MLLPAFDPIDVSNWGEAAAEPGGLRAKVWLFDENRLRWLRKSHRKDRPSEAVIETLALRLPKEWVWSPQTRDHARGATAVPAFEVLWCGIFSGDPKLSITESSC